MALPFEIQIGRIVRFLSKWASTKGSSPRVALGSEVTPTLEMWSGVENRFLDSWYRFGNSFPVTAGGAGNQSGAQLRNPSGSGFVAVIEKLNASCGTAQLLTVGLKAQATDLATVVIMTNRLDARANRNPGLILSTDNSATVAQLSAQIGLISGIPNQVSEFLFTTQQEITLLPGDAIRIVTTVANATLNVGVTWRERALEESELT